MSGDRSGKIRNNAATIQKLCSAKGIKIVGRTKAFRPIPEVVQAMIDSGIELLGDSQNDADQNSYVTRSGSCGQACHFAINSNN